MGSPLDMHVLYVLNREWGNLSCIFNGPRVLMGECGLTACQEVRSNQ